MSSTAINKENSINVLINSVRLAQKNGSYLLRESALLADAIDYFNPDLKEKPTFENSENPEIVAVNLLLQGVQKGQAHGGDFSYSLEDARLLWKIMEFWIKEGGKAVTQNVNVASTSNKDKEKRSAKAAALNTLRSSHDDNEEDNEEEDDKEEIRPIQVLSKQNKGKDRL